MITDRPVHMVTRGITVACAHFHSARCIFSEIEATPKARSPAHVEERTIARGGAISFFIPCAARILANTRVKIPLRQD